MQNRQIIYKLTFSEKNLNLKPTGAILMDHDQVNHIESLIVFGYAK